MLFSSATYITSKCVNVFSNLLPGSQKTSSQENEPLKEPESQLSSDIFLSITERLEEIAKNGELDGPDSSQLKENFKSIVETLIQKPEAQAVLNTEGKALLNTAIKAAHIDLAIFLMQSGINCDATSLGTLMSLIQAQTSASNSARHLEFLKSLKQPSVETKQSEKTVIISEATKKITQESTKATVSVDNSNSLDPSYSFLSFFSRCYRAIAGWFNTRVHPEK